MTIESTPCGAYGAFYDEWQRASETGMVQHFFPWWLEPAYVSAAATDLRTDELELMQLHGLSAQQIGFRRGLEQSFRGLRCQEFTCLTVFEVPPLPRVRTGVPVPLVLRRRPRRARGAGPAGSTTRRPSGGR